MNRTIRSTGLDLHVDPGPGDVRPRGRRLALAQRPRFADRPGRRSGRSASAAPIYNQGDQAGCYRLYQGTLIAVEPMLGHRPELQQEVAKGLKDVELVPSYAQRATDLRRILDRVLTWSRPIRVRIRRDDAAARPDAPKPLWTRLGGEPAVKAVVHDFVGLAASDPQVDFTRGGKYSLDAAGGRQPRETPGRADQRRHGRPAEVRGPGHEARASGDGHHRRAVQRAGGRPERRAQQVQRAEEGGRRADRHRRLDSQGHRRGPSATTAAVPLLRPHPRPSRSGPGWGASLR